MSTYQDMDPVEYAAQLHAMGASAEDIAAALDDLHARQDWTAPK